MAYEFSDDDRGYRIWCFAHPRGFVLNTSKPPSASTLTIHESTCSTISGGAEDSSWTTSSIKVCSDSLKELEGWAHTAVDARPKGCQTCRPYPVDAPIGSAPLRPN